MTGFSDTTQMALVSNPFAFVGVAGYPRPNRVRVMVLGVERI